MNDFIARKIVLWAIVSGQNRMRNTTVSGQWVVGSVECEELRVELLMRNSECGMRNRVGGGQCAV